MVFFHITIYRDSYILFINKVINKMLIIGDIDVGVVC